MSGSSQSSARIPIKTHSFRHVHLHGENTNVLGSFERHDGQGQGGVVMGYKETDFH